MDFGPMRVVSSSLSIKANPEGAISSDPKSLRPQPLILARAIRKSFGQRRVLAGIDLDVPAGSITGLVGPNGVGKTTLLRIVAGITEPDAGTILVCGEDISRGPDRIRHKVGFVPEEPLLMDYLTAHEALMLVGSLHNMPANTLREAVRELLYLWDLSRQEHQLLRTFSHGMKQKVLVLMALLPSPPVLLLDEPLAGLDLYSSLVLKELLRLQSAAGRAVLTSSHVLSLVEDVCDTIMILDRAEIVFRGPILAAKGSASNLEAFVLRQVRDMVDPRATALQLQRTLAAVAPAE